MKRWDRLPGEPVNPPEPGWSGVDVRRGSALRAAAANDDTPPGPSGDTGALTPDAGPEVSDHDLWIARLAATRRVMRALREGDRR